MSRVTTFKDFLKEEQVVAPVEPQEVESPIREAIEAVEKVAIVDDTKDLQVTFNNADAICVTKITDSKGRLSDTLEAITDITGFATLPLSVTTIPDEIVSLQRHQLYTLCGVRYAMATSIRDEKVNAYCTAITQNLQEGVPFISSLFKEFEYMGQMHRTLDLTEGEWTTVLSKFRNYKQRLFTKGDNDLILEVYPASSQN